MTKVWETRPGLRELLLEVLVQAREALGPDNPDFLAPSFPGMTGRNDCRRDLSNPTFELRRPVVPLSRKAFGQVRRQFHPQGDFRGRRPGITMIAMRRLFARPMDRNDDAVIADPRTEAGFLAPWLAHISQACERSHQRARDSEFMLLVRRFEYGRRLPIRPG